MTDTPFDILDFLLNKIQTFPLDVQHYRKQCLVLQRELEEYEEKYKKYKSKLLKKELKNLNSFMVKPSIDISKYLKKVNRYRKKIFKIQKNIDEYTKSLYEIVKYIKNDIDKKVDDQIKGSTFNIDYKPMIYKNYIKCENIDCSTKWFTLENNVKENWYCGTCIKLKKKNRN
ncbi:hypothetical protein DMUE_5825 [Dictyocoela muelleri]|nr:hypothetical protein DMUE_5825 [Dictyocoela muelleri]